MLYIKIFFWLLNTLFIMNQIGSILNTKIKKYVLLSNIVVGNISIMSFFYLINILTFIFSYLIGMKFNYYTEFVPFIQRLSSIMLWILELISVTWLINNYNELSSIRINKKIIYSMVLIVIYSLHSSQFLRNEISDGFEYLNHIFNYTNKETLEAFSDFKNASRSVIKYGIFAENKYYLSMSFWSNWYNINWFFEQRIFFHIVIGYINIITFVEICFSYIKIYKIKFSYLIIFTIITFLFSSWDIEKIFYLPMFISWYNMYIVIPILFLFIRDKNIIYSFKLLIIFFIFFGQTHLMFEILAFIIILYKIYWYIVKNKFKIFKYFDRWFLPLLLLILFIVNYLLYTWVKNNNYIQFQFCKEKMSFTFDINSGVCSIRELVSFSTFYSWYLYFLPLVIYIILNTNKLNIEKRFIFNLLSALLSIIYFKNIIWVFDNILYGFVIIRIISYVSHIFAIIIINSMLKRWDKNINIWFLLLFITSAPFSNGINNFNSMITSFSSHLIFTKFSSEGMKSEVGIERYLKNNNMRYNSLFVDGYKEMKDYSILRHSINSGSHSTYPHEFFQDLLEKKFLPRKNIFISNSLLNNEMISILKKNNYHRNKEHLKIRPSLEGNVFKYIWYERK